MSLVLSGTVGVSDVDGSAATPAIRGTDTNTGIFFPAADTIAFSEGGVESARFDANGNLGLKVTPSASWQAGRAVMQIGPAMAFDCNSPTQALVSANRVFTGSQDIYINSGNATAYQQVNGAHGWFTAPSGTAGTTIGFTQAMTLNTNGNLALQGGNTSANGVGITFPATQVASSDANTLDDYEEGTWTPTAVNGGTIFVVGSTASTYTKIGRQVTVSAYINMSGIPNNGSAFLIGGLPFATSGLTTFAYGAGAISYSGGAVTSDFGGPLVFPNSTTLYFHVLSGSNVTVSNATIVSRGITELLVSFTYFVA